MNQPDFFKNLPAPVRILFRPMLLISLGLHAVVLMLPTSFDWKKLEPPEKEEAIKITKLPPNVNPSPEASPQSSPQPSTQGILQRSQPTPTQTISNIPQPIFPSTYQQQRYQKQPDKKQTYSLEQKKLIKEANQPQPTSNQQESELLEKQIQNQSTNNQTQNSDIPEPSKEFFAKFPRYPDATPGSGSVLRPEFDDDNVAYIFHTEDDLPTVAEKFESELLPNNDFASPEAITDTDDFKVYKVSTSAGDETKYLHLIAKEGKIAIYLESEAYSLNDLMELKIEDDTDYKIFMSSLSFAIEFIKITHNLENFDSETELNLLNEQEVFNEDKFDFQIARKTKSSHPVEPFALADSLNKQLQQSNSDLEAEQKFEKLSKEGKYGEENLLYLVKNSKFKSYLTLAPAKDAQGAPITVMILSQKDPRTN